MEQTVDEFVINRLSCAAKTKRMIKKLSKYYIKLYQDFLAKKDSFNINETRRQLDRKALQTLGYIDNKFFNC